MEVAEIDISRGPDMLQISVMATEIDGGSPPADIDIYVVPDMLQTEISVTTTEMAGGSPPANIDICVIPDVLPRAMSVKTVMSDMSMEMDTPDVSRLEVAGGNPPAEIDINGSPDVLQRVLSVMAVVSEKWMERLVMNLKVVCSDGLAPDENPARRSSDVGSDGCVIQDPIPTVVSVRTVPTEEWMDRFVLDLVECPSVSMTSAVARTFRPAVSEEQSLEYAIQATASVWMPFEQVHNVVSGDVDFDSTMATTARLSNTSGTAGRISSITAISTTLPVSNTVGSEGNSATSGSIKTGNSVRTAGNSIPAGSVGDNIP